MENKILLVDGNLLLFKSFFATINSTNKMSTFDGFDTATVHTFMLSLLKILKTYNPTHCFIAFDTGKKTKRHQIYQEYKSGRAKAPLEIFEQKKIIIEILDAMNIFHMDMEDYEGDDLIASMATRFSNNNKIYVWSDDQDMLQLIDDNVSIIVKDSKTKTFVLKNIGNFKELHGFEHYQIPDFKGISGDQSDNLPGVKGVGIKGAINLLNKYGTLENIYNNLDDLTESMKNKFIASKEIAFMCKKLAKLELFLDIKIEIDNIKIENLGNENVINILNKYELNTIIKNISK